MPKYEDLNIYRDLGISSPEIMLEKANLVVVLMKKMEEKELATADAADVFDISVVQLEHIMRGQFHDYSIRELRGLITKIS